MKRLLLAAVLIPRIYLMEADIQKSIALDECCLDNYVVTTMDLVSMSDDRLVLVVEEREENEG
jgi:hypothetical protein